MTIKISLKSYANEIDRKMRPYGGIKAARNLSLIAAGITLFAGLVYSIHKSDVSYMNEVYNQANKYFISASTDSVNRKELAKQGLAIIDNYVLSQKGAIFTSTKDLNKLKKYLKKLE
jgi:hypothetical protein